MLENPAIITGSPGSQQQAPELKSIIPSDTCVIRHNFWNVSRVGSENSYCNRRNLYSPSLSLTSYVSSFITQSFRKRLDPYSVYSINRGSKLATGYTLDLGQLEIHSNDYFENWTYPESNPAFVPSANFQLAHPSSWEHRVLRYFYLDYWQFKI